MRVHDDWLLTPQRAAVHLPSETAVIADLHLGYSEARRRSGEAVPLPALPSLLQPLRELVTGFEVRKLVVAGDLFEDVRNQAFWDELPAALVRLGVDALAVVPGNHDRNLKTDAGPLLVYPEGVRLGAWRVVHGDGELGDGPLVLGHFHPCLRRQGHTLPCFLVGPDRIVLPAFSPDAAGVNVLRAAAWRALDCYPILGGEVVNAGPVAALSSRRRPRRTK